MGKGKGYIRQYSEAYRIWQKMECFECEGRGEIDYIRDQWNHRVSRRRLAGKYNKDGTLNKEWQAKQDAAKAAKQARWKANSGAEARLRRQGEVTRTQQLRTQGLLSSTNHRVSRRRLAGKYNKDGTINKEWQAKQDAAKAAKEARWGANAGA